MGNCCNARILDADKPIALYGVKRFTFDELRHATHEFNESIGEGGSSIMYIGWVGGMQVAVKRLNRNRPMGQDATEWLMARAYLTQLRHPNIIRLVGFCCHGGEEHMLVYKYMTNMSLDRLLFIDYGRLEWKFRLRALLGVARGLAHLHSQNPSVVYRDLKPSNILLDQDYNGVLADKNYATSGTDGNFGYVCPFYITMDHLSTKADVYSIGVVLLEVLAGKAAVDLSRPPGKQLLITWALPDIERGAFPVGFLDIEIRECPIEMLVRLRELVKRCIQFRLVDRPSMDEVVAELSSISD